jgi:hypothetical protein
MLTMGRGRCCGRAAGARFGDGDSQSRACVLEIGAEANVHIGTKMVQKLLIEAVRNHVAGT